MFCFGRTGWEEERRRIIIFYIYYMPRPLPALEVQLREEADCEEAMRCKLVTGHKTVTIGVIYRCPNITK